MVIRKFLIIIFILFIDIYFINSNVEKLIFLRPVPENVKLIHGFGKYKIDEIHSIFTDFYRYTPIKNLDINSILIKGMSKGIVLESWEYKPYDYLPDFYKNNKLKEDLKDLDDFHEFFLKENIDLNTAYKKGGLIIDYGYYEFNENKKGNIIGVISNIIPIVNKGDSVNENIVIAKFASKEQYGYNPFLTISFYLIDANKNIIYILHLLPDE